MRKHKLLTFLLSLLVATVLWVYAVTVVNPDDTIEISDIRVRVTGTSSLEADGLMLTSSDVQYVDVKIAGRRSDLKELNSSTLEAVANVSYIDKPGTYEVSWTLNPPATVASGDISLVGSGSNRITVQVSERWSSEVPLELEYTDGEPAEGYLCGDVVMEEYITVSGPAEEVGKIARAVVTVDLTGATSKIDGDFDYRLLDEDGEELIMSKYVTVSSETVHITVPVQAYKDVTLEVKLIDGGGLTSEDMMAAPYPNTIRLTGSEEALAAVEDTFTFEIDLAEIDGTDNVTLTETYKIPDNVNRLDEPSSKSVEVNIALSFNGQFEIMELAQENITLQVENGRENTSYDISRLYVTGNVESVKTVRLRGRSEELERLRQALKNGERIIARVDISKLDQSTGRYPLTIELPDGYAVNTLEEYSVILSATAIEVPEE